MRGRDAPFSDVAESYLRSKHKLRPWTKRTYAKSFARIGQYCPTIGDLTLDVINAYLSKQLEGGHLTIAHHDGGAAKRLAAWAVTATILRENPLAALSVPQQPKRRRKPFLDEEIPVILAAARASQHSERDVTIISLALACGLRKDELRGLRWPDDVDLKREILWVRDAKTESGIRCVPISARVCGLLDLYIKDWRPSQSAGPLFLNQHGDPFSYDGFSQIFTRIKKRLPATIDFKVHRARNTALTNWRRAGVDIATLARLAGHTDIAHTEHYLGDITPEEIARVPDAFGRFYGKQAV
ncbi:MAG: site-specific integrase [Chloroflexota bacterium]|nr:site-specific integrase [Chloroflexota bacterium]